MTIAQDEARRRNALKSTGPKTAEGKKKVSLNALKHGLCSKTLKEEEMTTITDDPNYQEQLSLLKDHYKPRNPMEEMLVQRIAILQWRLDRVVQAEQNAIHAKEGVEYSLPPAGALERILRYERTMDRELHRTINLLHQMRGASKTDG